MTRQIQDIAKPHLPAGPWVSTFALRTQKGVVLRLLESRALVPSRFPDKVIHFPMPKGLPAGKVKLREELSFTARPINLPGSKFLPLRDARIPIYLCAFMRLSAVNLSRERWTLAVSPSQRSKIPLSRTRPSRD